MERWRINFWIGGLVGIICLAFNFAHAQNVEIKTPKRWSPPDKSFSIEFPTQLKKERWFGETSDSGAITSYAVKSGGHIFFVHVLSYNAFSTKSTEDKFGGLFFVLGGDDDHDFEETIMTIDNLPAQQIVYRKQTNKGVFIDAGNMVVVLGMAAKTRKDLDFAIANRLFSSFRLYRSIKNRN